MAKERLDVLVVARGLAETRAQAQHLIMAGQVLVDGHVSGKPGHKMDTAISIELKEAARFVSRGGDKLSAAIEGFKIAVAGRVCLDIGASTGGFTDCLLQNGAAKVFAVDVGKGQLHWKLRNDARVIVIEEVNARYLSSAVIPGKVDLVTIDVSFISLTKVLPAGIEFVKAGGVLVTLIKPQFEAGRDKVQKGGVVRDESVRQSVIASIRAFGTEALGLTWGGVMESPLRGPAGNVEFLAHWKKPEES